MGGGWLEDDDDDDEVSEGDLGVSPGMTGIINDTPVVFDVTPMDAADAERTEMLHPVLMQTHQENVTDFLPDHDRLVVVFDDKADPDPQLGLETDEADGACSYVTLNGVRIATVDVVEGLTLDHITLVPESSLNGPDCATPESAAA